MKTPILIILTLFSTIVAINSIKRVVSLKQNCTGYLKRAADANTIETAKAELQVAIEYLEKNNLTKGYTSVMWQTPDEDIAFWYNNIKASQNELMKVDSTTSSLEKSNLLMKLRETLLDNGKEGDSLTVPDGLEFYPENLIYAILNIAAFLIIIGLLMTLGITLD